MKRFISVLLIATLVLAGLFANASKESMTSSSEEKDYSSYTLKIYTNTTEGEESSWIKEHAKAAGFNIQFAELVNTGDLAAVQAANENKDGDIICGLNETRWTQIVDGTYENLKLLSWEPTWADQVGTFAYPGKAYGITIQNVLMLYRNDEYGTNGVEPHFKHWSDLLTAGYTFYRQGKISGTTNANINNCFLFPYADPTSPAGGISIEGWKALWAYCKNGIFTGDKHGFDPLNQGKVQLSTFYSSSLYGNVDTGSTSSEHPLTYNAEKKSAGNWGIVKIDDGSYYISEYIGVLDKKGRSDFGTEVAKAFCEWFGSTEVQIEYANEFNRYPANKAAAEACDIYDYAGIYSLKNLALEKVKGTDMNYCDYVALHSAEWTNILTNLGFFWADQTKPAKEPDWATVDWKTIAQ